MISSFAYTFSTSIPLPYYALTLFKMKARTFSLNSHKPIYSTFHIQDLPQVLTQLKDRRFRLILLLTHHLRQVLELM